MANQLQFPMVAGFVPTNPAAGTATYALNAATKQYAFGFVSPPTTKSLTKFQFYQIAVNGTLEAGDLQCDIYASSAGTPTGASLATSTTVDALPTTAAFVEFAFTAEELTAGTQYFAVVTCPNAGAGRYVTVSHGTVTGFGFYPGTGSWGYGRNVYTGAAWVGYSGNHCGWRIGYSDGTYQGFSLQTITSTLTDDAVYDAREQAASFTVPDNAHLKVAGITAFIRKVGSPTGNLRYRLYSGSTLVATTLAAAPAEVLQGMWHGLLFATPQTITQGSYKIAIGTSTGGDTSNYWRAYTYEIQNTAASLALRPWSWALQYLNSTWGAANNTSLPCMGLILDTDGEFDQHTTIVIED